MTERDPVIEAIAEYAAGPDVGGDLAFDTARLCLIDSIGCALLAMNYPACTKLLGPYVDGTRTPGGARVPGTSWELDPVKGRVRHRRSHSLARLQRHLAGGGMGASLRQLWRYSCRRAVCEPFGGHETGHGQGHPRGCYQGV